MADFFGDNKPVEGRKFEKITPREPAPAKSVDANVNTAEPQLAEPEVEQPKKLYDELIAAGKTEEQLKSGVAKLRSGDKAKGLSDEDSKRRIVEDLGFPESYVAEPQVESGKVQDSSLWRKAVSENGQRNATIALRREILQRGKESGDYRAAVDSVLSDVGLTRNDAINMGLLGRLVNDLDKGSDMDIAIKGFTNKLAVFKNLDTAKSFALEAYGLDDDELITNAYNKAHRKFEASKTYELMVNQYGGADKIPADKLTEAKAKYVVNNAMSNRASGISSEADSTANAKLARGVEKFIYGLMRVAELPIPKSMQPRGVVDFFNENNEEMQLQEKYIDKELEGGVDWYGLAGEIVGALPLTLTPAGAASAGASFANIGRVLASGAVKGASLKTKAGALLASGAVYGGVQSLGTGNTYGDAAKDAAVGAGVAGAVGGVALAVGKVGGMLKDYTSQGLNKKTPEQLERLKAAYELAKKTEMESGVKIPEITLANKTEQAVATSNPIHKYEALERNKAFAMAHVNSFYDLYKNSNAGKLDITELADTFRLLKAEAKGVIDDKFNAIRLEADEIPATEAEVKAFKNRFVELSKDKELLGFKFASDTGVSNEILKIPKFLEDRIKARESDKVAQIDNHWNGVKTDLINKYNDKMEVLRYDLSKADSPAAKEVAKLDIEVATEKLQDDLRRIEIKQIQEIKAAKQGLVTTRDFLEIADKVEFELGRYTSEAGSGGSDALAQILKTEARKFLPENIQQALKDADAQYRIYKDNWISEASSLAAKGISQANKKATDEALVQYMLPVMYKDKLDKTLSDQYQKLSALNLDDVTRQKLAMSYIKKSGLDNIKNYLNNAGREPDYKQLQILIRDFNEVDFSPVYTLLPKEQARGAIQFFEAFGDVLDMIANLSGMGTTLQGAKQSVIQKMYNYVIGYVKSIPYIFTGDLFGGVDKRLKKVNILLGKMEQDKSDIRKLLESLAPRAKTTGAAALGGQAANVDVGVRGENLLEASQQ